LANQTKDKKEKGNFDPSYYTVFPDKIQYKGYNLSLFNYQKEINIGEPLEFRFTPLDKFYNLL